MYVRQSYGLKMLQTPVHSSCSPPVIIVLQHRCNSGTFTSSDQSAVPRIHPFYLSEHMLLERVKGRRSGVQDFILFFVCLQRFQIRPWQRAIQADNLQSKSTIKNRLFQKNCVALAGFSAKIVFFQPPSPVFHFRESSGNVQTSASEQIMCCSVGMASFTRIGDYPHQVQIVGVTDFGSTLSKVYLLVRGLVGGVFMGRLYSSTQNNGPPEA